MTVTKNKWFWVSVVLGLVLWRMGSHLSKAGWTADELMRGPKS